MRPLPRVVDRVWLLVSCVAALWLVSRIAVVYSVPTIPTWNMPWVPWVLCAQALAAGALVCAATLGLARVELVPAAVRALVAGAALAGTVAGCVLMGLEYGDLRGIQDAYGSAAQLAPAFWAYVAGDTKTC